MLSCTLKNTLEYLTLKKRSGVSEFNLSSTVEHIIELLNRYPYLDEIPYANSESYVKDLLKIRKDGSTDILTILNVTGASSLEEAILILNNTYSDLNILITPINNSALITIERRPNLYERLENSKDFTETDISESKLKLVLSNALLRLLNLGVTIKTITNEDLLDLFPEAAVAKAFIYNGEIYINIDKAKIDAPIHELLHILLGATRYINPQLYNNLVQIITKLPNIDKLAKEFPNRTESDVLEEIFVDLFAKFLTGLNSLFNNTPLKYEAMRLIKRLLDTILNGNYSVQAIDENELVYHSLLSLAKEVESPIMNNNHILDLAHLHRVTANVKLELMEKKLLVLECN